MMNQAKVSNNQSSDWQAVLSAICSSWPTSRWCNVGVVVGCSGGADSVALLRALAELRSQHRNSTGFLVAAHFHHGIRGQEADEDAGFVEALAAQLGIRHELGLADQPANDEAAMRAARTAFLRQTAQTAGARYVAVAHSADDNVETVLHNLMRGTGPKGLAGIPHSRALGMDPIGQDLVLIRPLLNVRGKLLRDALRAIGQAWREDRTNIDAKYRRNWIRAQLLPLMESRYPNVVDAVARAVELQNQWKELIEEQADQWIHDHVSVQDEVTIRDPQSSRSPIVIAGLQKIWAQKGWPLGEMTQEHWQRLLATIQHHQVVRYSLPGQIDVSGSARAVVLSVQTADP
jgi:tRNA(Ile)-lysidine synthase